MATSLLDCPFCKIVRLSDPDVREIYRNSRVVAFFPTEPATLGHTLVVPRVHVQDIWGLDEKLAGQLASATILIASAIRRAMKPDGMNIIQSSGSAATQSVPHLHIHLVPRWTGDAIGRIWPPETNYSERQKDSAWEKLRVECRALMQQNVS